MRCQELPKLPTEESKGEEALDEIRELIGESRESDVLSYELTQAVEVHILQLIAPLVEGSTLSREELLAQIEETVSSIEMPATLKQCLKEPEDLLSDCFTRQENLPAKLWKALKALGDVDSSSLPRRTWKVRYLEVLEPRFK